MPPRLNPSPETLFTRGWEDYALLDSGHGRKLERYGGFTVVRPEPQCFWAPRDAAAFDKADAVFDPQAQDDDDDGRWRFSGKPVETFPLAWRDVRFTGRFTPFRHLAFFPEQAANWEWLDARVRTQKRPKVLNLFGYTGVASLACSAAGAEVTHVDASKRSVAWARENAGQSGLADRPIRWIVEDCRKYVAREVRRGVKYDGIILDPPKYGRGPTGEVWRLFEDLPGLLKDCAALLSDDASFLLLNAYAARISGLSLAHLMMEATADRGGVVDWGELALAEHGPDGRAIGLSFFARWSGPVTDRLITSLTNDTVKAVRALNMRKEREATGRFLAEGLKFIGEALDQGRTPTLLLVGMEAREHPLLDRARTETRAAGGEVVIVTHPILEKISRRDNPQTVLGVFDQVYTPLSEINPKSAPCWVALEQVRDPGNLGTIIRTADAAGCGGVILIDDCVDPYSTEAVRATMGSVFAVSIARATSAEFLAWRQAWPGSVIGTRLDATHGYRDAAIQHPALILMGNEQAGLTDTLAAACDVNVKIPMRGRADSLNLAIATGVMVYAVTDAA